MREDSIFSYVASARDRNRRERVYVDTCDRVPSVHRCIVEFLFRRAILISDVGEKESETAEVDVSWKCPRTCYDFERENKISLQKSSATDVLRFISIWLYGREFRACKKLWHVSRRVATHRVASRCTASSLRDLASACVNAASDVIKQRGPIRLGFNSCLLVSNVPDCVPSVLHLPCICVNFEASQKLIQESNINLSENEI